MKTIEKILTENFGDNRRVYIWLGEEILSINNNCNECYNSMSNSILNCRGNLIDTGNKYHIDIDICIADFKLRFKI